MKRTLSSWYEDGLADLALGGYFRCWAPSCWAKP